MAALFDSILRPKTELTPVSYTGTAGTSAATTKATGQQYNLVQVMCTTNAHIAIGSAPTATVNNMPIPAWVPMVFKVHAGDKISAIRDTTDGTLYVTEMD